MRFLLFIFFFFQNKIEITIPTTNKLKLRRIDEVGLITQTWLPTSLDKENPEMHESQFLVKGTV